MANIATTNGASAPKSPLVRTARVLRVEPRAPNPPFGHYRFSVHYEGGKLWTDEEYQPGDRIEFTDHPDGKKSHVRIPKEQIMNQIIPLAADQPLTMSSREIADLVNSRHDKVKQSIERLAERGVIGLPPMGEVSNDGPGPKTISIYNLCKRDSLVVVAQLCPEFTAKVVDRWQELEAQIANPTPASLSRLQLIELAMQAETERLALEQKAALLENKVEEQAPKVAALERIEAGKKSLTITEAAKVLGVKRDELTRRLHKEGWIYRQNRSWVAHSAQIHAGRMEYKEAHYTDDDGHETARPYCHLTPKGLSRFARILGMDSLFQD
ncbi:MAG: phage antirepressor KilAC domain-containing protein [Zoogloeaceae bacterium]|nr:phage antirepressor KilAC domain-containing protein [Zoogloeaceae bacterium]